MTNERTVVDDVYDTLSGLSPEHADDFNKTFKNKGGSDVELIKDLNSYFRMELSLLSADTRDARDCLIDDLSTRTWLSYFVDHVARLIVKHKRV